MLLLAELNSGVHKFLYFRKRGHDLLNYLFTMIREEGEIGVII